MTKDELYALAERYQNIADKAFHGYQETGITRYATKCRDNERLAEALRMAAYAAEYHNKLAAYRAELMRLVHIAQEVKGCMESEDKATRVENLLNEILAFGALQGFCKRTKNES